jgi:soluble lytic murein transglycosylase-like protein
LRGAAYLLARLLVVALGATLAPNHARAGEIYSYTDADGVVHFSNVPNSGRYRKVRAQRVESGVYRINLKGRGGAAAKPVAVKNKQYDAHIEAAAEKYKLPVALLKAVMAVESNFNDKAVSVKGAQGLMQLMPGTAKDMYVEDAWDPIQNIEGGARYLRVLANQYDGDMIKTLAAYNAGPEAVRRAGGAVPNIPETRDYVRKVFALYQAYKDL